MSTKKHKRVKAEGRATVEEFRVAKKTPEWLFLAAKQLHSWPLGKMVTESAYTAAIRAAGSVGMKSPTRRTG